MLPEPTLRLRFREMTDGDLDRTAALLGDPEVMRYYPRPKTREEAQRWIDWSRRGYATEAARACVEHAFDKVGAHQVVAIIHPDNAASRGVAERIGMSLERATRDKRGHPVVVYSRTAGGAA